MSPGIRFEIFSTTIAVLAAVCYLIPSPIDPKAFSFPEPIPKLAGSLQVNDYLQRARRLFEGQLIGPESFAVDDNGTLYTGTADGRIWAIRGRQLHLLTRTGMDHPECGTFELEPLCGRPKGMKVDKNGDLIVVDSYRGLLKVNTTDGRIETLLPSHQGVDGIPFKFLNGLCISSDGLIYFTDSSTKWERRNYRYEVIETNNYGRLLEYNPATGRCRLLLDGLYLANGIALSADETYLVIAEMSVCQIQRYFIKGEKAGQSELLINNLPGYPDNIERNKNGNFYVGMGSVRFQGASPIGSFLDLVGPYPAIKRFIAKVTPFKVYNLFLPKHAIFIEVNGSGQIVNSFHDPTGTVIAAVGEAFPHNGSIYLGHFQSPFLGELKETDIREM